MYTHCSERRRESGAYSFESVDRVGGVYTVLLPVDRNETHGLNQSRYVSRFLNVGSDLTVIVHHVAGSEALPPFESIQPAVDVATRLEAGGIDVTRLLTRGGISQEIMRVAEAQSVDEIVIGGRRRRDVSVWLLGSTARDVTLSAHRPVTIIGDMGTGPSGQRTVLLPVDDDEQRVRRQVEFVTTLPNAPSIQVVVCHVFESQDFDSATAHSFDDTRAAVEAADRLESAGHPVDRVGVGGELPRAILDQARRHEADAIVMGGRKRTGIQQAVFGSRVQEVLVSTERPVTIVG